MMLEELLKIGFLTGSRAFGTAKEGSDWDVVISIEDTARVSDLLAGHHKVPSDYFAGYYVDVADKRINIIPVHPHEFLPWYLATKAMKATLKTSGIVDPISKYSVFMGIVSLYKGVVDRRVNLGEYMRLKEQILKEENDVH